MNNLDVTKFGVQELYSNEMMNVEGGALIRINGFFEWAFNGIKSLFN